MVDTKRYTPSNKRFQEHTKSFVEGTTRKGHLSKDGGKKDKYKTTGKLIRVEIAKIRDNGWYCDVDEEGKINCNYGDNIIYLPPHTTSQNGLYYLPTETCEVEISVDKKTKIHTITRINNKNKQPITMTNSGIEIKGSDNAALKVKKDTVTLEGNVDLGPVLDDINIDTSKHKDLPDSISVVDIYKEVQALKKQAQG